MDELLMGLLTPEQQVAAQQRAQQAGLLNLGFGLLQASQGQRGQPRPGFGQILAQAGPQALQSYQGSFERTLRDIMLTQQVQDAQRRRQQEAAQQASIESYISGLPEDQQARFRAFPTQASEAMFRESKPAPGVVGEFQAAQAAGLIGPDVTLEQFVALKKPPGTTVNVGGDKDPFTIESAKKQADVFSGISAAGSTASKNLQNVKRLENTLSRVETGGAAAFKQFAGNFGIKTEGLDDIQAATAIINRLVPEQRAPGSGPMSDADLELFKQSLPRIINTPGGNKKIVEGLKEINNYIVKEAKIANDVLSKKITPEEGRNKLLELGDPVQDFFERNQTASPGSPRTQLPQADQDLINRYLRR
jgi:flagellar protein FlgJ